MRVFAQIKYGNISKVYALLFTADESLFFGLCGVMRAAAMRASSQTSTTSCNSALRSADCMLQFPEDRTRWRRHGTLHADPADAQEEHRDQRPQGLRHRQHRGAGQVD